VNDRQREIVKALIQMAWADHRWAPEEETMVANVLLRMGCESSEVEELKVDLRQHPDMAHLEAYIPDHDSRLNAMRLLLAVAFADNALASEEYSYIQRTAAKLSIDDTELDQLRQEALRMRAAWKS